MNDVFRTETNQQLLREARIGLTLLAVTLGIFAYVVYHRISSSGNELPDHVLHAPIAESVWPGEDPSSTVKDVKNSTFQTGFGNMISNARRSFGLDSKPDSATTVDPSREPKGDSPTESALASTTVPSIPKRQKPTEFELSSVLRQSVNAATNATQVGFDSSKRLKSNPVMAADKNEVELSPATKSQPSGKSVAPPVDATTTKIFQHRRLEDDDKSNSFEPLVGHSGPVVSPVSRNEEYSSVQSNKGPFQQASALLPVETPPIIHRPEGFDMATELKQKSNLVAHPDKSTAASDRSKFEYRVQFGDSFWSIAQHAYDDGRFFRALFEYNRKQVGEFENLVPGITVSTPEKAELQKLWPDLCPKMDRSSLVTDIDQRIYVTRSGDTLFDIARRRLGQASKYLEILEANKTTLDPETMHLTPLPDGLELFIPYSVLH